MKILIPEYVAPLYKAKYWDAVSGDDLASGLDWPALIGALTQEAGGLHRHCSELYQPNSIEKLVLKRSKL